jgi:predicted enzyme related to lactoylglutathione lyase
MRCMKHRQSLLVLPLVLLLASCASSTKSAAPAAGQQSTSAPGEFQLDRLTFAVTNTENMVAFYQSVFNMRFKRVDGPGAYLYEGKLFGINYLLVPNEVAGVRAEQSRYQIEVKVPDVDAVVKRAVWVGGTIKGGVRDSDSRRTATIIDPDGNTIIFFQGQ